VSTFESNRIAPSRLSQQPNWNAAAPLPFRRCCSTVGPLDQPAMVGAGQVARSFALSQTANAH
jgi:hypothetical protein